MLPTLIVHADWGTAPKKRWLAKAVLQPGDHYLTSAPEPVGVVGDLLPGIQRQVGRRGCALVGFDFPVGLPSFYASAAGIQSLRHFLPQLGRGEWADFLKVANKPSDITLRRPFYPLNTGGKKQADLVAALGAHCIDDLRRVCELKQPKRTAACSLFWTLGANQVGKGATIGWRDVLAPALRDSDAVVLWPFDGSLQTLLKERRVVIVETYPREYYTWFFPNGFKGKRRTDNRKRVGPELMRWAAEAGVEMDCQLRSAIEEGFPQGDDSFDAVVGLLGMLEVVVARREPGEPQDEHIRSVEGWILGQTADRSATQDKF